jgi:predicted signal transduction protein with EAL and GGDEF domain
VAQRLLDVVRSGDTVARVGGDEFVILCEGLEGEADLSTVCARIRHVLAEPVAIGAVSVTVPVSIGVAFGDRGSTGEELLREADMAMYQAKAAGGARFSFADGDIRQRAEERFKLEGELRDAIERREFVLHYQPVIDLETEQVIAVEALIRWKHPERGLLYPGAFISMAEDGGQIVDIGRWVLDEACAQVAAWNAALTFGREVAVNVNMSGRMFDELDVCAVVDGSLRRAGARPEWLCLEITESILLDLGGAVAQTLEDIREMGVKVALDDFGTGYSSLEYLRHLPTDCIKIDRCFVDGLPDSDWDEAIVRSVVSLGAALGLHIVAEGVENVAQLIDLRSLGVGRAQGFFISKPQETASLEEWAFTARREIDRPARVASEQAPR